MKISSFSNYVKQQLEKLFLHKEAAVCLMLLYATLHTVSSQPVTYYTQEKKIPRL